jgi:carbonic anhydrase
VPITDELLQNAKAYAATSSAHRLPSAPARHVAIVACMDARIDPSKLLGLGEGDAHVIRNAGGVVTDDVIRSLAISQRLLGTDEIILIHHTDCGMSKITDEGFRERVKNETGVDPPWRIDAFGDVDDAVRRSMNRIQESPFVPEKGAVRGFVFEVETRELREVSPQ